MRSEEKMGKNETEPEIMASGKEMDKKVAEKMKWKYEPRFEGDTEGIWNNGEGYSDFEQFLAFSTYMDNAMQVVQFVENKFGPCTELWHLGKKWFCGFRDHDKKVFRGCGSSENPAHAICIAFLRMEL